MVIVGRLAGTRARTSGERIQVPQYNERGCVRKQIGSETCSGRRDTDVEVEVEVGTRRFCFHVPHLPSCRLVRSSPNLVEPARQRQTASAKIAKRAERFSGSERSAQ